MKIEKDRTEGTANQKKKLPEPVMRNSCRWWWWIRWVRRTEPADIHDE